MAKESDIRPIGARLYFIPVSMRTPLRFGRETVTQVTCLRVALRVQARDGRIAEGWGETPLSVPWAWPGESDYSARHHALKTFCAVLTEAWAAWDRYGHPLEVGYDFLEQVLPNHWQIFNSKQLGSEMPWLAALLCCSAFDIALHDAFGCLHGLPTYHTYNNRWMNEDLNYFLTPAADATVAFHDRFPEHYLEIPGRTSLPVWHLVGGGDMLENTGDTLSDTALDYPETLRDWIRRDGLKCLKIKLQGIDRTWDYDRIRNIGGIAREEGVHWLSTDFNGTVTDPEYVTELLDRLLWEEPDLYGRLLYVEQPFPPELHGRPIDGHSISARKPLFMDESAHDWRNILSGRELGWTGVALKTCKTQTGALLSLCWAKAHGMPVMVQDLTNPMLAQLSHLQLGAHARTLMGIESNSMQFCPEASQSEADRYPEAYRRQNGAIKIPSIDAPGLGYQIEQIDRLLPEPEMVVE